MAWGMYGICAFLAFYFVYTYKYDAILIDDASVYNLTARNFLQHYTYTLDGTTPYFGREPGYSVFLAFIYSMFGVQNTFAVFLAQVMIGTISTFIFTRELVHWLPKPSVQIFTWLLLLYPSVWVAHMSILRESITLSLFLISGNFLLRSLRNQKSKDAIWTGVLVGILILVDAPFFLLPFFILPFLYFYKIKLRTLCIITISCIVILLPWTVRNYTLTGSTCIAGCNRADLQWAVRGIQAKDLRGMEPMYCLYSEYISRNYDNRSPSCGFNAVMHRIFPTGFTGSAADAKLGAEGKQLIKENFVWYAWHSLFEVVELHLPNVNSWGFVYNSWLALYTCFVFFGILLGIRHFYTIYWLLLAIVIYTIGIYTLSDAIPRYLIPILFCYCIFSSIGYYTYFYPHER